jgi:hypothetical protein
MLTNLDEAMLYSVLRYVTRSEVTAFEEDVSEHYRAEFDMDNKALLTEVLSDENFVHPFKTATLLLEQLSRGAQ